MEPFNKEPFNKEPLNEEPLNEEPFNKNHLLRKNNMRKLASSKFPYLHKIYNLSRFTNITNKEKRKLRLKQINRSLRKFRTNIHRITHNTTRKNQEQKEKKSIYLLIANLNPQWKQFADAHLAKQNNEYRDKLYFVFNSIKRELQPTLMHFIECSPAWENHILQIYLSKQNIPDYTKALIKLFQEIITAMDNMLNSLIVQLNPEWQEEIKTLFAKIDKVNKLIYIQKLIELIHKVQTLIYAYTEYNEYYTQLKNESKTEIDNYFAIQNKSNIQTYIQKLVQLTPVVKDQVIKQGTNTTGAASATGNQHRNGGFHKQTHRKRRTDRK